jgi:hypothetical protein
MVQLLSDLSHEADPLVSGDTPGTVYLLGWNL